MLLRQKSILRMLSVSGGSIERLRLVKLMFLLSLDRSIPPTAVYDFVPYRYGPYSFTLCHDWGWMIRNGLGDESSGEEFALTELGHREAERLEDPRLDAVERVVDGFAEVETSSLIDYVYDRHRWFTLNSERETEFTKPLRPIAPLKIYTVGYQGISVDALLNNLMRTGIGTLVDVRADPIARRFGFHKSTLRRLCEYVEIRYEHEPRLGVRRERRMQLADDGDLEAFLREYRSGLEMEESALRRVEALLTGTPTALMCLEADERFCHRSSLAYELRSRIGLEIEALQHSATRVKRSR